MRTWLAVGMAVAAWGAAPSGAEASCNAIPSADMLSVGASPPVAPGSPDRVLPEFGLKGALGRIDRVYLIPGTTPAMAVVSDGKCADTDAGGPGVRPPALARRDVVALIYFQPAGRRRVVARVYADPSVCRQLEPDVKAARPEDGELPVDLMPKCSNDVRVIHHGTTQRFEIPLPTPKELHDEFRDGGALPSVRVVITSARAPALGGLLVRAANRPCRDACGSLREGGAVACIDQIFALATGRDGQPVYEPDPMPCTVQMPEITPNDFSKVCTDDHTTPPFCSPSFPALAMWEDECGGLHVPFDWSKMLLAPQNGTVPPREVRGRSGVGRKPSTEDPRIWVPGREFLGSTPIKDPSGKSSGVSWRKPFIKPWYADDGREEYGMQGTIDQPDSIVHVFPQVPTKLVCSGTDGKNACMGIEQGTRGYVSCACDDLNGPDCTCEELAGPRLFVCGSGPNRGMPCTRDRHCNPGGRCDGTPRCHEPGDVWDGPHHECGRKCHDDHDCDGNGKKTQCGYRLFNLADAIENPKITPATAGTVALDAKLPPNGPRKRRGACEQHVNVACSNKPNGKPGRCKTGDCRGYLLRAGGAAP